MQACAIHAAKNPRLINIETASTLQENEVRVRHATGVSASACPMASTLLSPSLPSLWPSADRSKHMKIRLRFHA